MADYAEWLKRPEAERNAEAATDIKGWHLEEIGDGSGCRTWVDADGKATISEDDWDPCTDRNATDILLAEIERRGLMREFANLLFEELPAPPGCELCVMKQLRAPASLLTWACVAACKEEA